MRQAFLAGQEITDYILDWGELDEIKSVLLAQAQMFVGQVTVKADNTTGVFSPGNPSSLIYGQAELNQPVTIWTDGVQVFGGILKASECDFDSKEADLLIENQFSNLASTLVITSQVGVDPALAILGLLQTYNFGPFVDTASFQAASGLTQAAGAVVTLNIKASDKIYLLDVINQLAELASLSVFVHNDTIECTAFQAYQGSGAGLRQPITAPMVRAWGKRTTAYNTFYNQVIVPYGASSTFQADNLASQTLTRTVSTQSFSTATGQTISVADLASATYFAQSYLNRASSIRDEFSAKMGQEFANAVIGYRYPVTNTLWGYASKTFEVIETKRTLSDNGIELTLASL